MASSNAPARFRDEVRTTAVLAAPLVCGHLSTGLIGFVDSVIAGHHGTRTLAAVSVALLTAPSSYHRLRFRHGNKEHMIRVGNRLSIAGIAASAVSLEAVVLLVMDAVLSLAAAIAAAVSLFVVVASLWYVLPLLAALRDRRAR